MYVYVWVRKEKSPIKVVGLRQMFREADFPWEVLIDDNIVVLLQAQFIVPGKDTGGYVCIYMREKPRKFSFRVAFLRCV